MLFLMRLKIGFTVSLSKETTLARISEIVQPKSNLLLLSRKKPFEGHRIDSSFNLQWVSFWFRNFPVYVQINVQARDKGAHIEFDATPSPIVAALLFPVVITGLLVSIGSFFGMNHLNASVAWLILIIVLVIYFVLSGYFWAQAIPARNAIRSLLGRYEITENPE
ncbi:MAG: hypothetical protein KDK33_15460 [Leptospiraceae bacterium]|nr:hypothetical protein [Leptospiraceae bacterium]